MRIFFAMCLVMLTGCKTLQLAVTHPISGVHIVARMDAHLPEEENTIMALKRLPLPDEPPTLINE